MDYMFFDLECANGSAVCSFGYIITDSAFNIIDGDDILINPECEFRLSGYREDPRIRLAYPIKAFRKSPNFKAQYARLTELLTAPERVLLGHAISADIEYLDKACARYGLEPFDIDVYDTQKMYAAFGNSAEVRKLETIMTELGIPVERLTAHKSRDDAEMSMLAVKAMCERRACGIESLLANNTAFIISRAVMARAYRKRRLVKLVKYLNFLNRASLSERKLVYCADFLESDDLDGVKARIEALYDQGYAVTFNPSKSDLLL